MEEKKENSKKVYKTYTKGKYKILPLSVKKEAVQEYLKFETPLLEIARKYGVDGTTVRAWVEQVERGRDRLISHRRVSKEVKMKIVREILSGHLTVEEAKIQYDIVQVSTVQGWVDKFSCQISLKKEEMKAEPKADNIQFEKALQEAQLKILALETMIDVAEKELKIGIRKKSGTKQSK